MEFIRPEKSVVQNLSQKQAQPQSQPQNQPQNQEHFQNFSMPGVDKPLVNEVMREMVQNRYIIDDELSQNIMEEDAKLLTKLKNVEFRKKMGKGGEVIPPIYDNVITKFKVPKKGHIAWFIQGNSGIIRKSMTTPFGIDRDYKTHSAWALFKQKGFMKPPIKVPFYASLARLNDDGTYTAFFEATTYTQTILSPNEQLAKRVNMFTSEIKTEIQGLIAVERTLDKMFAETKSWLKENLANLLVAFSVMIMAVAIFYQTSAMAGLSTGISHLVPGLDSLNNLGTGILQHLGGGLTGGTTTGTIGTGG